MLGCRYVGLPAGECYCSTCLIVNASDPSKLNLYIVLHTKRKVSLTRLRRNTKAAPIPSSVPSRKRRELDAVSHSSSANDCRAPSQQMLCHLFSPGTQLCNRLPSKNYLPSVYFTWMACETSTTGKHHRANLSADRGSQRCQPS